MEKLKSLCKLITKGTTPSTYGFDFQSNGINFIKSECLVNSRTINLSKISYISDEANNKLFRSKLEENDILMSIAGAYLGKLGIVKKELLPANINQAVAIIRVDITKINPFYLYYYLSTEKSNKIVNNVNAQSAQPNINLTQIGNLDIYVPPFDVQQHIVDISAYPILLLLSLLTLDFLLIFLLIH